MTGKRYEDDAGFAEHLRKLRAKASKATQYLIDGVEKQLIPILEGGGFAPSPEAVARNKFGLVWGVNELAFQDRAAASWPTVAIQIDRSLASEFKVYLFEIPMRPIMLDGTELPRGQANAGHAKSLLLLRKGRSSSYRDQHFGAPWFGMFKESAIRRDLAICRGLLERLVSLARDRFVESVEAAIERKFLYKSWDEFGGLRPNRSL